LAARPTAIARGRVGRGVKVERILLDYLFGDGEQRRRDGDAERLGGLQVDDELELCRLRDRQVRWLLALVWGSRSQAHFAQSPLPSFIPVSLFDLESRFFASTHTYWRPARTGAVKAGRRSALAACSVVSRPRLDSPEHGGTLVVVGMTARETRAATLYPVGRSD